jgi:hypothetical protein
VIAKCTKRTRDAIDQNEDIKNAAERRQVMQEILNQTVNYLEEVFVDTPSKFGINSVFLTVPFSL